MCPQTISHSTLFVFFTINHFSSVLLLIPPFFIDYPFSPCSCSLEGPRPPAYRVEGPADSALRWQSVRRAAGHLKTAMGLSWPRLCELAGVSSCSEEVMALLDSADPAPPTAEDGVQLWRALESLLAKAVDATDSQLKSGLAGEAGHGVPDELLSFLHYAVFSPLI